MSNSWRPERPTHDMADVLLSLKHAVLRTSPDPLQMQSQAQNYNHPQASLSYTVHPQILVSPNHQSQAQNVNYNSMGYYDNQCNGPHGPSQPPPPSLYPSMSVNVSMNMTMHGYGSDGTVPVQCSQVNEYYLLTFFGCVSGDFCIGSSEILNVFCLCHAVANAKCAAVGECIVSADIAQSWSLCQRCYVFVYGWF